MTQKGISAGDAVKSQDEAKTQVLCMHARIY